MRRFVPPFDGVTEHNHIADEIARVRRELNLTLEEFAARVGIPLGSVYDYERGRTMPPADRLLAIAHATRGVFRLDRVRARVAQALRAA